MLLKEKDDYTFSTEITIKDALLQKYNAFGHKTVTSKMKEKDMP